MPLNQLMFPDELAVLNPCGGPLLHLIQAVFHHTQAARGDPEASVEEGRVSDVKPFPLLPQEVFPRDVDTVEREESGIRCEETHLFFQLHVDREAVFFAVDDEGAEFFGCPLWVGEDDKVGRDGSVGDEILLTAYLEAAPVLDVCCLDGDGVAPSLRFSQGVSEDGVATGRLSEVTVLLLLAPPILDCEAAQALMHVGEGDDTKTQLPQPLHEESLKQLPRTSPPVPLGDRDPQEMVLPQDLRNLVVELPLDVSLELGDYELVRRAVCNLEQRQFLLLQSYESGDLPHGTLEERFHGEDRAIITRL